MFNETFYANRYAQWIIVYYVVCFSLNVKGAYTQIVQTPKCSFLRQKLTSFLEYKGIMAAINPTASNRIQVGLP